MSEALLLFAEHEENTLCTKIVLNFRNNFCTQHVLPCSAKRRASDKDLPVLGLLHTLSSTYIRVGKTGSLGPWSRVIVYCSKLSFCQNDSPIGGSFWQKDSLITHILFELCLFRNLAQCTLFLLTL